MDSQRKKEKIATNTMMEEGGLSWLWLARGSSLISLVFEKTDSAVSLTRLLDEARQLKHDDQAGPNERDVVSKDSDSLPRSTRTLASTMVRRRLGGERKDEKKWRMQWIVDSG